MTQEERIAQLEQENAELRAQLAEAYQQISQLAERLQRVEGQLAKDSHNSSKPPSSDGPRRRPWRQRQRSEKPTGGQPGHTGGTLMQVASPDEVVHHRPVVCAHCQQSLEGVAGQLKERRQVYDLPEIRLVVREHQVEEVCCPTCQQVSRASFPEGVEAPAQYGPKVRALAVYLHEYQLVPLGRVSELLADLCACEASEGAVLRWVQFAAERLAPTVERIADWLSVSPLQHADETGVRIAGKLHWLHVNSTRFLTHLAWHTRRGRKALEDIGIWPRFRGRAMRDRWASYDHYPCAHSICGAHLVRDCVYISEQEQQTWAAEMADLLLSMAAAAAEWRKLGAAAVPADERDAWIAQYFDLVASGFAAQPPPSAEDVPKRGGRRKQSAAKNLLDELLRRAEQVLAFLDDLSIPFTKSQVVRALSFARGSLYLQRKRPLKDKRVAVAIEQWHELDDTLGHRKLAVLLGMGKNRVNRIMHTYGITARRKKKRYVYPGKTDQVAPNLVKALEQSSPTEVVFSDIFEVRLADGTRVRGCFALWKRTRHILALAFDYRMQAELVVKTIEMVPFEVPAAIFHSDQGKQYGAAQTRKLLLEKGFVRSMSRAGTPTDNGYAERVRRCALFSLVGVAQHH